MYKACYYLLSAINLLISDSKFKSISLSFAFLCNVLIIKLNKSIPVESVKSARDDSKKINKTFKLLNNFFYIYSPLDNEEVVEKRLTLEVSGHPLYNLFGNLSLVSSSPHIASLRKSKPFFLIVPS